MNSGDELGEHAKLDGRGYWSSWCTRHPFCEIDSTMRRRTSLTVRRHDFPTPRERDFPAEQSWDV